MGNYKSRPQGSCAEEFRKKVSLLYLCEDNFCICVWTTFVFVCGELLYLCVDNFCICVWTTFVFECGQLLYLSVDNFCI